MTALSEESIRGQIIILTSQIAAHLLRITASALCFVSIHRFPIFRMLI
jgi:hypothetical protein